MKSGRTGVCSEGDVVGKVGVPGRPGGRVTVPDPGTASSARLVLPSGGRGPCAVPVSGAGQVGGLRGAVTAAGSPGTPPGLSHRLVREASGCCRLQDLSPAESGG